MDGRRGRVVRVGFCLGWFVALGMALREGAKAAETTPEHLIGLLGCGYLAAWGPFFLLSRRDPAGRLARFAAASGSIALGLVAFEGPAMVGLIDYRAVFQTPTPPWKRPGNRPDPDLIYVREGHQRHALRFRGADMNRLRGSSNRTTYRSELVTDRDGFRNPADLDKADVVILGDSFVEGLQVAAPELVSARLADRLGAEVANLGRTGYGPQQELQVLRRFGLPLRPKTVVWAFYEGNDLQDVATYDAERKRAAANRPESPSRARFGRSFARNGLAYLLRTWLHPEPTFPAQARIGQLVARPGRSVDVYFSCGVHEGESLPEGRGHSPELGKFRATLAEATLACERAGVDLVVAFVPTKFRVYRDRCAFGPEAACRTWALDDLPEALGKAVAEVSPRITFLDLTPTFQADADAGNLPYLVDDTHWSAQGHQVAARAIGDLIAGTGRRDQLTSASPQTH